MLQIKTLNLFSCEKKKKTVKNSDALYSLACLTENRRSLGTCTYREP